MIAKNDNSNKNNNDNNNNSNNNIERGKVTLLSRITINVNLEIHLERPVKKLFRPSAQRDNLIEAFYSTNEMFLYCDLNLASKNIYKDVMAHCGT